MWRSCQKSVHVLDIKCFCFLIFVFSAFPESQLEARTSMWEHFSLKIRLFYKPYINMTNGTMHVVGIFYCVFSLLHKKTSSVSSDIQFLTIFPQGRKSSKTQLPLSSVLYLQPGRLSGYLGDRRAEHTNTHTNTHSQPWSSCVMVYVESCQTLWGSFSSSLPTSLHHPSIFSSLPFHQLIISPHPLFQLSKKHVLLTQPRLNNLPLPSLTKDTT